MSEDTGNRVIRRLFSLSEIGKLLECESLNIPEPALSSSWNI
jgi:hypothetical protein